MIFEDVAIVRTLLEELSSLANVSIVHDVPLTDFEKVFFCNFIIIYNITLL